MSAIRYWAVFTLGVAAGAAVALMYAPQTGVRTRRQLKRNLDDATDFIKDRSGEFGSQAEKYYKRGRETAEDYYKKVRGPVEDFVSTAAKVSKKVADLV